jgi:Helix-turn-helix domain of resolvase
MDERKIALASKLMHDCGTPISEVREAVGVSKVTLYRYLKPDGTPRQALAPEHFCHLASGKAAAGRRREPMSRQSRLPEGRRRSDLTWPSSCS